MNRDGHGLFHSFIPLEPITVTYVYVVLRDLAASGRAILMTLSPSGVFVLIPFGLVDLFDDAFRGGVARLLFVFAVIFFLLLSFLSSILLTIS